MTLQLRKKMTKVGLKPGIVCLQHRYPTIQPTKLTAVLGYFYLFKLLPNLTLTLTLKLDPSATYS